MKTRKWTDQQLIDAFNKHDTLHGILKELGLAIAGGSYTNVKKHLDRLGLEFNESWQERSIGALKKYHEPRYSDSEVFCENTNASQLIVRNRFEKIIEQKCSSCGLDEWLGSPLSLDLDHVDGNRRNNKIENLRWLCPNCHRQTITWGSKNK